MDSDAARVRIRGNYFPAQSSQSRPAVLSLATDGRLLLANYNGGEILECAREDVDISPRVGSIPRRIIFADSGLFVTPDNDAVDMLDMSAKGRRSGIIHRLERFRSHLLAFAVIVALLAAAIYRYALPVMIEVAVAVTPPVVPDLLGAATLDTLDRAFLSTSRLNPVRRKEIEKEFAALSAFSQTGGDRYTLLFRGGGFIGPNAFALPDGTVIITDELLAMAEDDEMIFGVLAHEIGHVEKQHSLRQPYRLAGMSALIMLIAGDVGDAVEDALVQGTALLSLSYSREHEREADRHSVELMLKAGHNPLAINEFFRLIEQKLGRKVNESGILSTHPATADRAAALEEYADRLKADSQN